MQDAWHAGDPYEYFMGRWSKRIASQFVDWLSPQPQLRWLDVGCGSGALSEAISERCNPTSIIAIDQSEGFVQSAQSRLGNRASCRVGNALSLPLDDHSVDVAVSGLVLNFLPDPKKMLEEMKRVTDKGGIVGVYIWDYAGTMAFLNLFWDVVIELHSEAAPLHEGRRFSEASPDRLIGLFNQVGLANVEVSPVDIVTHFTDFEDYWEPFLGGQGPAPTFVMKLTELDRQRLKQELANRVPYQQDGSIMLSARAWAVKGWR